MKKHKKIIFLVIIAFVFLLTIGYSIFTSNLTITGTSNIRNTSFDVHFENLTVTSGSVEINSTAGEKAAKIDDNDNTKVTYQISLAKPGDFYEFEVYAVNRGSLTAKINQIVSTLNDEVISNTTLPDYLTYTIGYSDGSDIEVNETLAPNESKKYKVRIEFDNDINPEDLPDTEIELSLSYDINFIQSEQVTPKIKYKVVHKKMNLDGSTYTVNETEYLKDEVGIVVTPEVKSYTGFTAPETQTITLLSEDNSTIEYLYSRNKYNLTLEDTEFIITDFENGEYYYETPITLIAKERENYSFIKWSNENINSEITFPLIENTTIKPIYQVDFYTVTFHPNGGTLLEETRNVSPNSVIGDLPTPEKEDFSFDGWYLDIENDISVSSGYIMTSNIDLYAKYSGNKACTYDGELETGAEYVDGQYTYRYMQDNSGSGWSDIYSDGWGVVLTNKNSTTPVTTNLCKTINDKPIVSMRNMFSNSKATSIDTSSFDTSNVTDMSYMFSNTKLSNIDISNFDTSNVDTMRNMFVDIDIDTLNMNGLDLSSLYVSDDYYYIFGDTTESTKIEKILARNIKLPYNFTHIFNIKSLETIDVTNWDLTQAETLGNLFEGSSNLKNIIGINTWDTSNVSDMSNMFNGCSSLEEIDISSFRTDNLSSLDYMFGECSSLKKINMSGFNILSISGAPNFINANQNLEIIADDFVFDYKPSYSPSEVFNNAKKLSCKNWVLPEDISSFFDTFNNLETIDVTGWDLISTTDISYLFNASSNLEKIIGLDTWDTSNITNMSGMFYDCRSIKELDLSSFNTENVTNTSGMFYDCDSIEELDLSSFRNDSLEYVDYMFEGCDNLRKLNLSNFNVASVNYNGSLFSSNVNSTIILDNWTFDYSPSVSILDLFYNVETISCKNWVLPDDASYLFHTSNPNILKTVDVTGWDLSSTTNISSLFSDNTKLESIVGLETWNTSNIVDMSYMFNNCNKLKNIDLSNFDTSNVEDMSSMFYNCEKLKSLDLTSFNTSNLYDAQSMFENCESLETIYATNNFTNDSISESFNMFFYDNSLIGGNGTIYDPSYIDKEYAHLDAGEIDPGYFSIMNKVVVTFNPNGGFVGTTKKYVDSGSAIGELPIPEKEYATFEGWFTNTSFEDEIDENTIINTSVTYYAKWNNSLGIANITNKTIYLETNEVKNINITNANDINEIYTFVSDDEEIATVSSNGNVTGIEGGTTFITVTGLTSNISKIITVIVRDDPSSPRYTITYNANGGTVSGLSKTIKQGNKIGNLLVPTRDWFTFDGWYTGLFDGVEVDKDFIPSSDMTIYARWIEYNKFTITFDPNGGETSEHSRDVHEGERIGILPDATRENHCLDGWYTGLYDGIKVDKNTIPTSNIVLYAMWLKTVDALNLPVSANVTVNSTTNLVITGDNDIEDYTISIEDPSLATVNNNVITGVAEGITKVIITGEMSKIKRLIPLYVTGVNSHEYTVTFNPNGGETPELTRTVYENLSVGALPTPTKTYKKFGGWKDDNNNYYVASTVPTEDTTLNAVWLDGDYVCRINDVYYETITSAVESSNDYDEIVLIKNVQEYVEIFKILTLNLDGYTLEGSIYNGNSLNILSGTIESSGTTIMNNGSLVLGSNDATIDSTVTIIGNSDEETSGCIYGYNYSSITINKANIENNGSGSGEAVSTHGGTIILNNGNISSNTNGIVATLGLIEMNGGTVDAKGTAVNGSYGSVTMTGGTIISGFTGIDNMNGTSNITNATIISNEKGVESGNGTTKVSNSNIIINSKETGYGISAIGGTVNISDSNINITSKRDGIGIYSGNGDVNATNVDINIDSMTTSTGIDGRNKQVIVSNGEINISGSKTIGISNDSGTSTTINDVIINATSTDNDSKGVDIINGSNTSITNSTIIVDSKKDISVGIDLTRSTSTTIFRDSTINVSSKTSSTGFSNSYGSDLSIDNSTINIYSKDGSAEGIENSYGEAITINNSNFTITSDNSDALGIRNADKPLTVTGTTFDINAYSTVMGLQCFDCTITYNGDLLKIRSITSDAMGFVGPRLNFNGGVLKSKGVTAARSYFTNWGGAGTSISYPSGKHLVTSTDSDGYKVYELD